LLLLTELLRGAPTQAGEAGIVAVQRDPLAAGLYRECSKPGVGNQISARVRLLAHTTKDRPMLLAGLDDGAVRWFEKKVAEVKCFRKTTGLSKHLGMSHNAEDAA
jgi:hypothetical protein